MTSTTSQHSEIETRTPGRGAGYLVAIAVNLVLLYVANNLLDWGLVPFLTDEFGQVLWLINISLLATILVNLVYLVYDPAWFKSVCQIGLGAISLAVSIRMYQVFPFDFSAYQFNWTMTARIVMIAAIVGVALGIVVEIVKLGAGLASQPKNETTMRASTGGHS
jgi:uncharacterized membrane protein YagU involved in acid resistance